MIDKEDANHDLAGQLLDAALTVRELRREGKTVLLHCVHADTHTPIVAAVYGARDGVDPDGSLERVVAVLPSATPRRSFARVLEQMEVPG